MRPRSGEPTVIEDQEPQRSAVLVECQYDEDFRVRTTRCAIASRRGPSGEPQSVTSPPNAAQPRSLARRGWILLRRSLEHTAGEVGIVTPSVLTENISSFIGRIVARHCASGNECSQTVKIQRLRGGLAIVLEPCEPSLRVSWKASPCATQSYWYSESSLFGESVLCAFSEEGNSRA